MPSVDAKSQIEAMIDRGWVWSSAEPSLLVHPQNHAYAVRFDPATNTLTVSPELEAALEYVIPTPAARNAHFRRDERRPSRR
jgi:hypothetical protein